MVAVHGLSYAERDWEYWSQESFSYALNKKVSLLILPEWRFKNDMHDSYLFKLENGIAFKVNEYFEIIPYYVYQEKKSSNMWDSSNLAYLDEVIKIPLKEFFDLKISDRFRYQYDFDKGKAVLRNSLRISRVFPIAKLELVPYLMEEPFYDTKLDRITEHRSTAGILCNVTKNISFGLGYMLNSKKAVSKWTYANVLVSNLNIKF